MTARPPVAMDGYSGLSTHAIKYWIFSVIRGGTRFRPLTLGLAEIPPLSGHFIDHV